MVSTSSHTRARIGIVSVRRADIHVTRQRRSVLAPIITPSGHSPLQLPAFVNILLALVSLLSGVFIERY